MNLQQAKSVVSFYTQLSSTDQFPITVFIGDDSVGVLSANRSGIPTPSNDNDALAYKLSTADKWYAKSSKGCLWAGDISVDGTESYEPISLEDCNAGAITFWTSSLNENLLPINVSLNGVDNIGEVEKTGEATECFSGNGLSVGRKAGVYQYTASSSKNSCNWTGTITVTEGGCELIELSTCDE